MIRFVKQKGSILQTPSIVRVYASGVIQPGEAVDYSRTLNQVYPASASSTYTTIFGVALETARSNSDSLIRVAMFAQGQLWSIDTANAFTTSQLFIKHSLAGGASGRTTLNNTATDQNNANGIFLAYQATTDLYASLGGTASLIGEFIRAPLGWVEGVRAGYF